MTSCPRCQNELSRSVNEEGMFPRFRACSRCSYPLEFEKLWKRVEQSAGTDAAVGSMFGPGLKALTYEEAVRSLRRNLRFGVDALAEYENAIVLRNMDSVFVLNFGAAGECSLYWGEADDASPAS